jgi:hypothetical protein
VADEIHLWQMIFIHGSRFGKLIFPKNGKRNLSVEVDIHPQETILKINLDEMRPS